MSKFVSLNDIKNITDDELNKMTYEQLRNTLNTYGRQATLQVRKTVQTFERRGEEAPLWLQSHDVASSHNYKTWQDTPWEYNKGDTLQQMRNKFVQLQRFANSNRRTYTQIQDSYKKFKQRFKKRTGHNLHVKNDKDFKTSFFKMYNKLAELYPTIKNDNGRGSFEIMRVVDEIMDDETLDEGEIMERANEVLRQVVDDVGRVDAETSSWAFMPKHFD